MPFTQIIYENRNAVMSSQAGYIVVTIPNPPTGLPHMETLWNRMVDDATLNLMPALRLAPYLDQVDLLITPAGLQLDFTRLDAALAAQNSANLYEGTALFLDLYGLYGKQFDALGWNGIDQLRNLMQAGLTDSAVRSAFSVLGYSYTTAGATSGTAASDVFVGDTSANNFDAGAGDDLIDGGAGNDALYGRSGHDTLLGGGGNDSLNGGAGDDVLDGGSGNDYLSGGDGNDTVYGQAGDDVLDGGTGADNVQGGDGNDIVMGGTGNDTLFGGNGNDILQGNAHNDTLYGQDGNDVLDGGSGNDYLMGGAGADIYLFGRGAGQDTLWNYDSDAPGANADTIQLGAGIAPADVVLTRSGDSLYISINGSDDRLEVQSYFYQDGVSNYAVENIAFADGTRWDVATVKTRVLAATAGNDTLYGYATNDTINGSDGNDTVYGQAGDDVLDGGTGADTVQGGAGNDTVKGGNGNDTLYGGNGNDILQGNAHNDILYGDAGNDVLDGGSGNDYLMGGAGADVYLFGRGAGQDTLWNYDSDVVNVNADTVKLGAGIAPADVTLTRQSDDLIISLNGSDDSLRVQSYFNTDGASSYVVENLKFADGTVWNYATVKANLSTATPPAGITVNGTAANETLTGGLGNDTVYGQAGNDTLDGGIGNDTLDGGAGNDTYLFGRGSGKDTISAYDGTPGKLDAIQLGAGVLPTDAILQRDGDTLVLSINGTSDSLRVNNYFYNDATYGYQVEQIKFADGTTWDVAAVKAKVQAGTGDHDRLYGYAIADTLSGLAGDDIVYARSGNDTLDGGAGEDQLYGEDGDDLIRGGTQNDRLDGGNGNDNLQGQDGDDTLYGQAGNDTLDGGLGNDTLDGGAGNDTYLFGRGSGQDRVSSYDPTAGNTDVLSFGNDITVDQLWLRRVGSDLEISIIGTPDKTTIGNWYSGGAYHVEQFKTTDGKTLLDGRVDNLVNAMASFAPPPAGQTTLPPDYQTQLNPVIAANWQ